MIVRLSHPSSTEMHQADLRVDEAMKPKVLPELPDLEIETEAISTWCIDDWRSLKQKERSPIFECGGHPW